MLFPDINKLPPLDTEFKEFQQYVRDIQRKYSQLYKVQLGNEDAYRLALYILCKHGH